MGLSVCPPMLFLYPVINTRVFVANAWVSFVDRERERERESKEEEMGVESNSSSTQQPIPSSDATSDQVQALLEAARYDDIDDVVSLSSMGVSLDSKDSQGRTALHMAAANGHLDIVGYLISNSVCREADLKSSVTKLISRLILTPLKDVNALNAENNTPLHWACLNGHIEVVKALILGGATVSALNSYERTPVDEAVNRGKLDVVDAISAAVAQVELEGIRVS